MRSKLHILPCVIAAGFLLAAQVFASDGERDFLTGGLGVFDFVDSHDRQAEFRLEYRGKELWGPVRPVIALAGIYCPGNIEGIFNHCPGKDVTGSGFFGGGAMIDYALTDRIIASPSLTAHYYTGGNVDLDLDSSVLFRYQLEIAYRFQSASRLGVAISRYDNFGLGDTDPGSASLMIYYSIPLDRLFSD